MSWWLALAAVAWFSPQSAPISDSLDRVLAFRPTGVNGRPIEYDRGAAGAWQLLQKLQTTGSILHTTAHPDDEHVGMLTRLGRGDGVRTALLTLNRGEGGANALGPELFDALGLLRTEELRLAGSYYGLDDLYFTTAIDYGFSKTLREARASWDLERVLGDMVRVIRLNRPLVVISRFHGSPRDGHGHHQAAGVLTPLAVEAAADPTRFPSQITNEGLRPWRARKLYRGGVRSAERAQVTVDAGVYSPWLGDTYEAVGRFGVSLQRSQTSGRLRSTRGPAPYRYERLSPTDGPPDESGVFDGLDTSISGIFTLTGEPATDAGRRQLRELEATLHQALASFTIADPSAAAPALRSALVLTGGLIDDTHDAPDARFLLRIKERQIERALLAVLGVEVVATTDDAPHGVVARRQVIAVEVGITGGTRMPLTVDSVRFVGAANWTMTSAMDPTQGLPLQRTYAVTLDGRTAVPYTYRSRITENHYTVRDSTDLPLATPRPALTAQVFLRVGGTRIITDATVRGREARPPSGTLFPAVTPLPPVSVHLEPRLVVLPDGHALDRVFRVFVVNHAAYSIHGDLEIRAPNGLTVTPATTAFTLQTAGEQYTADFRMTGAVPGTGLARVRVEAIVDGDTIATEYRAIEHDDLEPRFLDRPAQATIRTIDVDAVSGIDVGYVMGVGDEVPAAIEQLGATVRLLTEDDLAGADLAAFSAIVIGTRAYAVRPDLVAHNHRLIDYAAAGGHLVVLYQTQEFVPGTMAPFPAALPPGAEEVSEENAPVRILAPDHPLLTRPNRISAADFEGWIEQRGSKFFTTWDPAYVPLVETHDTDQNPQRGVWLTAPVGRGRYTYIALALHRQLPYGVPGAYRILANLLAPGARP